MFDIAQTGSGERLQHVGLLRARLSAERRHGNLTRVEGHGSGSFLLRRWAIVQHLNQHRHRFGDAPTTDSRLAIGHNVRPSTRELAPKVAAVFAVGAFHGQAASCCWGDGRAVGGSMPSSAATLMRPPEASTNRLANSTEGRRCPYAIWVK